jgi:hypothetical protein
MDIMPDYRVVRVLATCETLVGYGARCQAAAGAQISCMCLPGAHTTHAIVAARLPQPSQSSLGGYHR